MPEPPAVEPSAETPELARIATHLRRDDEPAPLRERPEGFDVNAILDAVREVAGVRDAALRRTPAGAHSLRLDLADGADPAEVSRLVAGCSRSGWAWPPPRRTCPARPPCRRRPRCAAARPGWSVPVSRVRARTGHPARRRRRSRPAPRSPSRSRPATVTRRPVTRRRRGPAWSVRP
ncbi:hypothetical protein V2I01_09440 [Micromonospora sp. BRA006-A]|nr:hypothetical protein [Micromonospora sp. BRA006-A]